MITPEILASSIATLFFGLLLAPTTLRLRSKERVVFHLLFYIGLGFIASLSTLLTQIEGLPRFPGHSYELITAATLLALVLTFGALTLDFLKKEQKHIITYWATALVIWFLWSLFAFDFLGWGAATAAFLRELGLQGVELAPLVLSGFGWVMGIATTLIALSLDFRKRHPTQYLNRLRYWIIATTLLLVNGLILFISPEIFGWAGLILLTIASMLAGYIVLIHHTPDLRLLIGRTVRYLGVIIILFIVYFFSMVAILLINRTSGYPASAILWAIVLALALANISIPLRNVSYRFLTKLVFGKQQQDEKQIIRHYSRRISSALDMNRLGNTLITLMIETMGIERGIVFAGQRSSSEIISLRPLSSVGLTDSELTLGRLRTTSPFVDHFRQGKKILSQYDLDVLPQFRHMPEEEKSWLSGLGMELYVAISRERELIGLLAFGQQGQGTAYYEEDRDLMIALADQAALAMDSARLFEQLAIINQEVGTLTNQLAGLDQTKADFLSIASHELRTPLTHIHGYSRMLLDLTEEELSDPTYVKTIIEGIAKGSERMKGVIDVMFEVTEADVGEMNLFTGPVVLEDVLDMAIRPFLPALDERRIAFGKKGFKDLPIIEADGTRLVQAIENLIGNAIKYTPDGGVVTVEGRALTDKNVGSAVEIVVIDTGIGIDPQHQEIIFEKFFRVDDTDHHSTGKTKFKGAGPGLGLTLVKAIAEAHKGKAWVESLGYDEANLPGSKFFFVIPLQQPEAPQKPPQRQSQIETQHWHSKGIPNIDA